MSRRQGVSFSLSFRLREKLFTILSLSPAATEASNALLPLPDVRPITSLPAHSTFAPSISLATLTFSLFLSSFLILARGALLISKRQLP
ncbi:hypothetical protein EJ03DRAFT_100288 [Teratosphaeria nubilosa]|uniref:Uncharacterized protein n=1 Tax=Teratosphaeria nubilosa TaxID=161662 RepID=A0A6G1LM41_9PEZI|nr:hypothetical protein EJ03DRAFT_100288 [Teratosphaeria nubilosa]